MSRSASTSAIGMSRFTFAPQKGGLGTGLFAITALRWPALSPCEMSFPTAVRRNTSLRALSMSSSSIGPFLSASMSDSIVSSPSNASLQ